MTATTATAAATLSLCNAICRYTKAEGADIDPDTQLGEAIVTDPYTGAAEDDWLVTLARAVYRCVWQKTHNNIIYTNNLQLRML